MISTDDYNRVKIQKNKSENIMPNKNVNTPNIEKISIVMFI